MTPLRPVLSSSDCPPPTALVTGASSGIGLAACATLLRRDPHRQVLAVSRRATESPALAELTEASGGRLHSLDVDLADGEAIERLGALIAERQPRLDRVLHCAGILHGEGLVPEKSLQQVRAESLMRSFALNACAPVLLLRTLLPALRAAPGAVFASLSARVGSIADNRLGGWYAYRAAKAAQNQLLRTAAIELRRSAPGVCVLMLHPGTVDTPLSAPFQRGLPDGRLRRAEQAAEGLLDLIGRMGPEDSGRFLAWDGQDIPW